MPLSVEQRTVRARLSRKSRDYFDDSIDQDISHDFCVYVLQNEAGISEFSELVALYEEFMEAGLKAKTVPERKSKLTKLQSMRIADKVIASIDIEEVQSFLSRVNTSSDHDEIVNDYISEVKSEVEAEIKKVLASAKITDADRERVNDELKREIQGSISLNIASIDLDAPIGG